MIIKHDFNVHFVQKQTNKKFLIFDQNHGLTPLKKSQYGNSVKIHFYGLGGLFSNKMIMGHYFWAYFITKKDKYGIYVKSISL